ncbi:ATP-binding protein [Yinghuangia sp. ASG 101]|uniref:sensor histidine kinase n=1 Tax=Yinghuangia sp. ASG 101 TaxID=2896848 RepID=UPI001E2F2DD6|nr:ATP-binding protein [Yinghuangia sp. ASG 101]UGQ14893.1 ATP-binding protein [Yinghuangia sp. ASG 101]
MDVNVAAAAVAALSGLAVGVTGALAFRWSERSQATGVPQSASEGAVLPPGVAIVLSVLRSSAVVLDERDDVVKASSAAYTFGLVRGDQLVPDQLLRMARETRRDGEIRQRDLMLTRRDGQELEVSARVAPLGSRLVLLLVEDRTEARRVDAVRRDFVANVSHELKTPVGALSLLAEAVLDASDDPEAVRRFSGRMQVESARLTSLVQELIDLSRVQNDHPLQDMSPVPVDELVAEAVDRCRQLAQNKQIALAVGGDPGLVIPGDHNQLVMAIGNLVENAVNYSPERTRVDIDVRANGRKAIVAVSDQGIGIPSRELDRIFERFYRVDPARSRATGGTGLGLSIVKHIVAGHGGEVTVRSVEGVGTTFTLVLPLQPADERDDHPGAASMRPGASSATSGSSDLAPSYNSREGSR